MAVDIGDKAPNFALPNQYNRTVRLTDFKGFKLVLFAFPRGGTPQCTEQACAYRDAYKRFQYSGAMVLGISSTSVDKLRDWREEHSFPYDLLCDKGHDVLSQYGAWGYSLAGVVKLPMAERSYWVIDEEGIIKDMAVGIGTVESVEQSLAFVEENSDNSLNIR
jgi:peroxiredoxin Q/BCP